jgi:hypothetical protein
MYKTERGPNHGFRKRIAMGIPWLTPAATTGRKSSVRYRSDYGYRTHHRSATNCHLPLGDDASAVSCWWVVG